MVATALTQDYAALLLNPTHVDVSMTAKSNASSGASTWVQGSAFRMGYRSLPSVGNYVEYELTLAAGTHTLVTEQIVGGAFGKYEVALDGVRVGLIDTYVSTGTAANRAEFPGITVQTAGKHLVRLTVVAKNTLSSATEVRVSGISFTRIAATAVPSAGGISWSYLATDLYPHSIGIDGVMYGHTVNPSTPSNGYRTICRSSDGGVTIDRGMDIGGIVSAGEYIIWTGRTSAGYVIITSSDASLAGNFGGIYFSTSFTSGFTKVQTTKGSNEFSISKPELGPNGQTLLLHGEYSTDSPQPAHVLRLSQDGGQTWSTIRTAQVIDSSKNSHFHGSVYDPTRKRIWSSQGDNGNTRFSYSDDLGGTWTDVPLAVALADSSYQQPTALISFPNTLAATPDHSTSRAGVWTMSAATGTGEAEAYITPNGEVGSNCFGRAPYVQSGASAVVNVPDRLQGTLNAYFIGTGDAGVTWHLLATVPLTAIGSGSAGVVGPDSAGLIYWRGLAANPAPAGDNLLVAPMPTFHLAA